MSSQGPFGTDLFRQWQTLAAMLNPVAAGYGPGASSFVPTAASLTSYAESAEHFNGELKRCFEAMAAVAGGPSASSTASAAIRALSDALRDRFAQYFPALAGADVSAANAATWSAGAGYPALGLTREHQQRWQRALAAWNRMTEAQHRLQRLWSDALREAASAFASRLGTAKPSMPDAEGLHRLYSEWIDCAEDAYARVAHGEAFCDALADFANAGSEWRESLKQSVEEWSKWLDLPTRHELNSLLQRLQALEQERSTADRERPKPVSNTTRAPRRPANQRTGKQRAAKQRTGKGTARVPRTRRS